MLMLAACTALVVQEVSQHGAVNITLLPLSTGAAALDGSPYGFFFIRSATSTQWTISIQGTALASGQALPEQ